MSTKHETQFTKDASGKKLLVVRQFDAPVEKVFQAWTEAELLDQWWAPKPWKANTKSMDFKEGGTWLYYMQGPDGTKNYCREDYKKIIPNKLLVCHDSFCDEDGNSDNSMPQMQWEVNFSAKENGTEVTTEITFDTEADLEKIVSMGFKEGYTMGLGNLDDLLFYNN